MTVPQNPWQGQNPQQVAPQAGYPQQIPAGKPRVPGTVGFASVVGLVMPPLSAALSVLNFVIMIVMFGKYIPDMWSVLLTNVIFVGIAVVSAVLWIVFSLLMRRGRGWARTVLVVMSAIWLIYTSYSIASFLVAVGGNIGPVLGNPSAIIGMVQMFIIVPITTVLFIVLVFLKPSNDYFKATRCR
ncbi:hypothetical protein [Saccharopolyspora sp. ASAGF58]|uniref:hypothetical protein n=1 Tax=Saccharopolyspora sp. ASAGF58 TaxID=2719023 RepID=UPI001440149B|nr:hypothetical protein [Saccharopolyspora sp. ASAGF58]QIZ34914.1 hypothetical protein FDZ84_09490 [Saccharopolyspora sp. ASAGF58]